MVDELVAAANKLMWTTGNPDCPDRDKIIAAWERIVDVLETLTTRQWLAENVMCYE